MELLQVFTYLYLNQCDKPANQILTYLGYLHIAFQPFFMNMLLLYFIPKKVKDKISGFVYAISFAVAILILIRVYPFLWAEACKVGTDWLCGTNLCSTAGNWHLAWQIPLKNVGFVFTYAYAFGLFVLPLIYGSWKLNLYHIMVGPVLVRLIADSPNEIPAIWCLLSIAIFIAIVSPKFRDKFKVKKWYAWKYPKFIK